MKILNFKFLLIIFFILVLSSQKDSDFIIIQSTTSTRDSGFYDYIINKFNVNNSTEIRIIAVGTGQAIKNARNCDADILFVHHKPSEDQFVKEGYGVYRKDVMYNDFVLVGPKNDPAKLREMKNIKQSLMKIYNSKVNFISRGDESGTHKKETALWRSIRIDIKTKKDSWYLETGSGMGSSLNVAVNKDAYILTDRSTWITFGNKRDHEILVENEPSLRNYYGVIPVNPDICKKAKFKKSEEFINWLLSKEGQNHINDFKVMGRQLFFGNSKESS